MDESQQVQLRQPIERIAWERRKELGFFTALVRTIGQVIAHPTEFFRAMTKDEEVGEPLFFGAMTALFVTLISYIWVIPILTAIPVIMGGITEEPAMAFAGSFSVGIRMIIQAIMQIIWIVPALFINAGVLHLGLMIFGANKRSYINTFKVACYSTGASALTIIPIVGPILGLYKIAVEVIGLRETHETTTGKAILAWVIIPLICCVLAAIIIIPFAGAIIAAVAMD